MAQPARGRRAASTSTPDKRPLYVELTPSAYDGWQSYCDAQGITITALIEVLGQALHGQPRRELVNFDVRFAALVNAARAITAERRRRKP